MSKEKLIDCQP